MNHNAVLGRRIAAVLRWGTVLAVIAIAIGLVITLADTSPPPGPRPVIDLIATGGADALVAIGLLGLTLLPIAVLAVAGWGFARMGERTDASVAAIVLASLAVSLVLAAVVGAG